MLDIYICEDNAKQRGALSAFVSNYCVNRNLDAAVVLATHSPSEILNNYERAQNSVLFILDIELGADMDGIELAAKIREQGKKAFIVFLTTHSEMTHLTFKFQVEALDFVVKDSPEHNVNERIGACIETALKRHIGGDKAKIVQIKVDDKVILLDMDEIIYIETAGISHKLHLYTKSRRLEFNGELKTIESKLDERFIRCHKCYTINKDKIESISKKENTITLTNNSTIPISKNGKRLL